MAKTKKKAAVEEGAVVEPSAPEETEDVKEEIIEAAEEKVVDEIAEEIADDVIEEAKEAASVETTTIKYLLKGPIADAHGGLIYQDQTGDVVSHLADAMIGRGHAELVG